MLGLPNIKIAFNSLNTSISFSFNKDKKDYEKKELEDDASENECNDIEKLFSDYFIVHQENKNHVNYLLIEKNNQFLFDTRIEKKHSFDILIPPPETV
jgi:hypothetical protein